MPEPSQTPFAPVASYVLDGQGGARDLSLAEFEERMAAGDVVWTHLDRGAPGIEAWLRERAGLSESTCDALLVPDTRPRARVYGSGIMAILRVPNQNEGDSREDMIALRMWVEARRVFSVRLRRVDVAANVGASLLNGKGPANTSELLSELVERVLDRLEPVIDNLEERVDEAEDSAQDRTDRTLDERLSDLRRELAIYYRHLKPQSSALTYLGNLDYLDWYHPQDVAQLHESSERSARMAEDVEILRERADIVREERQSMVNAQLNRRMYVSAVAAALFLPLSFLTGLLGINVGGIPLAEAPQGFLIVCAIVGVVGAFELVVLWRRHWL